MRGGELTVDFLTGAFSYVSPGSLNHSGGDSLPEEFVYTLDGPGGTSTGTLTLDILDTEPVARPDTNSVPKGGAPVTGNILGNDTLADGVPADPAAGSGDSAVPDVSTTASARSGDPADPTGAGTSADPTGSTTSSDVPAGSSRSGVPTATGTAADSTAGSDGSAVPAG